MPFTTEKPQEKGPKYVIFHFLLHFYYQTLFPKRSKMLFFAKQHIFPNSSNYTGNHASMLDSLTYIEFVQLELNNLPLRDGDLPGAAITGRKKAD